MKTCASCNVTPYLRNICMKVHQTIKFWHLIDNIFRLVVYRTIIAIFRYEIFEYILFLYSIVLIKFVKHTLPCVSSHIELIGFKKMD